MHSGWKLISSLGAKAFLILEAICLGGTSTERDCPEKVMNSKAKSETKCLKHAPKRPRKC